MKKGSYKLIDLEHWPRREHFQYYREKLKCGYSLTGRVDVTALVNYAREKELKKFPCFMYAICRSVNELDEMKMMVTPEGMPGIWEEIHPNFTVFHPEDETFTDLWMEYSSSLTDFYQSFQETMAQFGNCRGIKGRPGQPPNFFCVSCVPWMDYTGYASHSVGEPALFPIVTFGKYTLSDGRYTMPVTVTISHAAADGYHTCKLFGKLQEILDEFHEGGV